MKHSILRPQVAAWPQMEEEGRLSYEDILVTIAQWSQPTLDISSREISSQLDCLASRILSDLRQTSPGHPIFTRIREDEQIRSEASVDLSKLPHFTGNLTENVWSSKDCKEILKSANNVLYGVDGFVGDHDDYYNADNSYINCLLENKHVSAVLSLLSPGNFVSREYRSVSACSTPAFSPDWESSVFLSTSPGTSSSSGWSTPRSRTSPTGSPSLTPLTGAVR